VVHEIRELRVGEILDQTVLIIKRDFALLFGLVAVALLPAIATLNLLIPPFPVNFTAERFESWIRACSEVQLYTMPMSLLIGYVISPITYAAVVWAVAKRCIGDHVTLVGAYSRSFKIAIPLLITNILYYLVLGLGFMACVVPFFLFLFWFCLVTSVVVIEGTWGPDAFTRSKSIVTGSLATIAVLAVMIIVIQIAAGLSAAVFGQNAIQAIASAVATSLMTIFMATANVVLYFSCRCKTEHYDLYLLANAVAQEES
jgi:hypothetical protein